MSLRILWVSHFLPYPPKGGVLQRGFGLVRYLGESCELHLLAMHQPRLFRQTGGDPANLGAATTELGKYCASVEIQAIPSESTPIGRPLAAAHALLGGRSYTERWLSSRAMARAVANASARVAPDVVHLDTISLAPYAEHCQAGQVLSLGHHNVESHMMWRRARNSTSALPRCLLRLEAGRILELEREFAPRVDLNVVCSPLDGRRLRHLTGATNSHVAENGVLEPEVSAEVLADSAAFAASDSRLLFVGRMSAYTNRWAADYLVREIWPEVVRRHPRMTLDIVGSGAPESAHQAARLDSRVRVHGFVRELSDVLVPGTIFVCPIREGGGTKLKILDAMNRGLPIVAHPAAVEGIDIQAGRHALLARTPAEFAEAIGSLADVDRRRELAANSFSLVRERYAFESIATQLLRRFELEVQNKRGARGGRV